MSSTSSRSTTAVTSPMRSASAASNTRADSSRSAAAACPTMRGRSQATPYSAIRPRRAKAVVNLAWVAAKRTSHWRAWTRPTPAHPPLMAATSGLSMVSGKVVGTLVFGSGSSPGSPRWPRSAPGQNERPAPVTTTARASRSSVGLGQAGEVGQLERAGHAVVALGTVEGDDGDAVAHLVEAEVGAHAASLGRGVVGPRRCARRSSVSRAGRSAREAAHAERVMPARRSTSGCTPTSRHAA